jgi:hypothetical protein
LCGIIDESAHVAFPPDMFSPGGLHQEPTFGWFVGYITDELQRVPSDDPLLNIMRWAAQ